MTTRIDEGWMREFFAYALSRTDNRADAEELASEIILRCLEAEAGRDDIRDPEHFFRGIARNTANSFFRRRSVPAPEDVFSNIPSNEPQPDEIAASREDAAEVRRTLASLSGLYRDVLVDHYYRGQSVREIARRRELSPDMVKYYLRAGRAKMKESIMNPIPSTNTFAPTPFELNGSFIDLNHINPWKLTERKLPCQILLAAYEKPKSAEQISAELATPAVYIEEEIALLADAGLLVSPAKNKYRANLHILPADDFAAVTARIRELYRDYLPDYYELFRRFLPRMRVSGLFREDEDEARFRWFFASEAGEFDERIYERIASANCPRILSDGSRGFVFAAESEPLPWGFGTTPRTCPEGTVHPVDVYCRRQPAGLSAQSYFYEKKNCTALFKILRGEEPDPETAADLIAKNFAKRIDGGLAVNVAVRTEAWNALVAEAKEILSERLAAPSAAILEEVRTVTKHTIPPQLAEYAEGFTLTWCAMLAGCLFTETLYDDGFLSYDPSVPYLTYLTEN
ncbi:MAG: sigma-70 family RNA polymerase sigma factor [Clostridia bacterium]|nr:sigma-70 family RNA polymerase sigma factor [Clostridia bacterium]MBR5367017.1 sigma-70 family RNA polymerase sigma factor [Clostridia bacterium]